MTHAFAMERQTVFFDYNHIPKQDAILHTPIGPVAFRTGSGVPHGSNPATRIFTWPVGQLYRHTLTGRPLSSMNLSTRRQLMDHMRRRGREELKSAARRCAGLSEPQEMRHAPRTGAVGAQPALALFVYYSF